MNLPFDRMDQIKWVVEELNQPPFNQNLNLISYDGLRDEQRLDLLILVLNTIDPRLQLPEVRLGNIEEIVATILDQLRIFKYRPPATHSNPAEFRKAIVLADKDLLTNILEWLLRRLPLLKKRAYVARFLVKIELPPEVETDQDVATLHRQYLSLMEEFKRIHSAYEQQKRSIDSIIDLQRDIKTMELEKDQIKNKLDIVRRRVNLDNIQNSPEQRAKFEAVRAYVLARHQREKFERQLRQQRERMEAAKAQLQQQQTELAELNPDDWSESAPEVILYRFRDEIDIKQKLAKDVLPGELAELRAQVQDMDAINQQSDEEVRRRLAETSAQVQALTHEINDLVERKLLDKQNEEDRLSHYRQNALAVAQRKQQAIQQCQQMERSLSECETELEQLRANFPDGDQASMLRGEALKLYMDKVSRRETEMQEMRQQLDRLATNIEDLQSKLNSLRQQEKETLNEIAECEELLGLEGYFQMKESTLVMAAEPGADEDDVDVDEDAEQPLVVDFDQINGQIDRLQDQLESLKAAMMAATKEVRILREEHREAQTELDMKKRLYEAAAAGLEAELSRTEAELERWRDERNKLDTDRFECQARWRALQVERDRLLGSSVAPGTLQRLQEQIDSQKKLQQQLQQQEREWQAQERYYQRQMEMWRDLRAIFELKHRLLSEQRQQASTRRKSMMAGEGRDRLVLND